MIDKIISLFDYDNQFNQVWQLKLIKFDCDLDNDLKPYEKQFLLYINQVQLYVSMNRYLAISHIVEDSKGNPGVRGHFYVTNLRLVWHAANDCEMNLSIGIDTIHNLYIKSLPNGVVAKFTLVVKTQSPSGSKYQFKFTIFTQKQLTVFKKAIQLHKQATSTRLYRSIDTNMKINYETRKFQLLPKEEMFNSYTQSKFYEDERVFDCDVVVTNVRVIILQQSPSRGISYGIPWIMLQSYQRTTHWDHDVIEIKVKGLLSDKQLYLRAGKQMPKLQSQFTSLATTYTRNPVLGFDVEKCISDNLIEQDKGLLNTQQVQEIQQLSDTKVNIKRKHHQQQYMTENNSQLGETVFDEQLGLMIQKLPHNTTRANLWDILQ